MTFNNGDPFDDLSESDSEGGGYTQLQALLMADLYEYPMFEKGVRSDEALREHRERFDQGPNSRMDMQSYYEQLRERMESASTSFRWWSWITAQLQYYGGICSIIIMLLLILGAFWTVFQQARKYKEELVGCLCGNFWVSRLIQICTWDSWKAGQRFPGELEDEEMKEMGPLNSPKRIPYASSSLIHTPSSQASALLSGTSHSPANWTDSLQVFTSSPSNTTTDSAPLFHNVAGVTPVRSDGR